MFDFAELEAMSGGGSKKNGKPTLMSVPAEVLQAILTFTIEEEARVTIRSANGRSSLQWRPNWIPDLLLVSKEFGRWVKPVIANNVALGFASTDKADPRMAAKAINLNGCPEYIKAAAKTIFIVQNRAPVAVLAPTVSVANFPQLLKTKFFGGFLDTIIRAISIYWITNFIQQNHHHTDLLEDIFHDEQIYSPAELFDLDDSFIQNMWDKTISYQYDQIFIPILAQRLRKGEHSVKTLFERLSAEVLGFGRDKIGAIHETTSLSVTYCVNFDEADNTEDIAEVIVSSTETNVTVDMEVAARFADSLTT